MELKTIYLAGGCFWGTQRFLQFVRGVTATETGYVNSNIPDPSYKDVCTGFTGAAEAVKTVYDPEVLTLRWLLRLFFRTIDPVSVNRQGNDVGTQYRTGIFYVDPADLSVINEELELLQRNYAKPLAIEVGPLRNFFPAEDYHQNYLAENPGGYCHVPRELFRLAAEASDPLAPEKFPLKSNTELRGELSPLSYMVTQQQATEPPFNNRYNEEHRPGVYVDITTGEPLFLSTDKFDSGCGWPAFSAPLDDARLKNLEDNSHGMNRVEVRASHSGAHLGHVFPDGPAERGGLRYCINSAALRFVPLEEMAAQGYGTLIPLLTQPDS